jgi:threonine aldolase
MLSFASDNYSGVHPEIMDALARVNTGHDASYGADAETAHLQRVVAEQFGASAEVFPVLTGTGSNVTALQAMSPRWGAVICARSAHIHVDEGGAPEKVAGLKLLPVETANGKLTPDLVDIEAWGWGDEHRAQPRVLSITQSTEFGTLYTLDELRALTSYAHERGILVHLDGARLANAAAALGCELATVTRDVGVDVLSFGGTKNGLMLGEAIIVLNPEAAPGVKFLRKTNAQLASKMRFLSAQLGALLENSLWRRNAEQANAMARRLRTSIDTLSAQGAVPGLRFTQPTEVNSLFVSLPAGIADALRQFAHFYDWDAQAGEVRWMCSFDTSAADVDAFADRVAEVFAQSAS